MLKAHVDAEEEARVSEMMKGLKEIDKEEHDVVSKSSVGRIVGMQVDEIRKVTLTRRRFDATGSGTVRGGDQGGRDLAAERGQGVVWCGGGRKPRRVGSAQA
jgi:hypothetical protein